MAGKPFGLADKQALVQSILGREPVASPVPSAAQLPGPMAAPTGPGDNDGDEKLTAQAVGYEEPGFTCESCTAFIGDGQPCAKVSDPVSAGGGCRVHSSLVGDSGANPQGAGEEVEPESGGAEEEPEEPEEGEENEQ